MSLSLLPSELKSKIQDNFTSLYDFINYCNIEKRTKNFCIEEYKRILIKKGYKKIPHDKIIEKVFNLIRHNQININVDVINFLFFGGKLNTDNIMCLFDKNMIQFFDLFVIKGDYRYKSLFDSNNIKTTVNQIVKYTNKYKNYLPTKCLTEELQKLKYIKEIFKKGLLLSLSKIHYLGFIDNYLEGTINALEMEKKLRIKENFKRNIKVVSLGIGAAVASLGAIGISKYINKKQKNVIKVKHKSDKKIIK